MTKLIHAACIALALGGGCATTTTTATTWTAPQATVDVPARAGRVEAVRMVVRRAHGNPAAGAAAGGLIGGLLFGAWGWPEALFGAAAGALVGGSLSSGYGEARLYEVLVRFDDGTSGVLVFRDFSPFRPGDRVALTSNGLVRAAG